MSQLSPSAHRQAINEAFGRGELVLVRRINARTPAAWEIARNLDLPDTIAEYRVVSADEQAPVGWRKPQRC